MAVTPTFVSSVNSHFNHEKVIEYSSRPFASNEAMTEALVENWNTVVARGDTVFHLGDFALSYGKKHEDMIDTLIGRLKGNKWLIIGNHDRDEVTKNPRWSKVVHYHEIKVDRGGLHKQRVVMCHYPLRTWNQINRCSWMLHGHSHGNLTDIGGKTMDVGVDCHDYKLISLDDVEKFMEQRGISACDHHVPE